MPEACALLSKAEPQPISAMERIAAAEARIAEMLGVMAAFHKAQTEMMLCLRTHSAMLNAMRDTLPGEVPLDKGRAH